jgi:prepilin-type N-terminal cleavage/methylation domain-containing protein
MMRVTRKTQQGFTLVELMVSILISTIMLGVAMNQLLGSRTLFALHEADSRIEENARYALEILSQNIRMASYVNDSDGYQEYPRGQFFDGLCDATDFNPCTDNGTGTNSDHFAIWYNPAPDNEVTACGGIPLSGTIPTRYTVADLFYIAADPTSGINSLRCRSYTITMVGVNRTATLIAGSDQTIIDGIINMQVLYGLTDRTNASSLPVSYVSADTVNALVEGGGQVKLNWSSIISARVTILVGTGFDDGADQAVASRTYNISDSPPLTFTDGNRRKIFSSTVAIDNANL